MGKPSHQTADKKGIDRPDCPTMNGASIIKYAWYRLYIKFAGDPEFQDAAVLRIAAREASKLAADAAAAAAVVLAAVVVEGVAVEGVALNGENGNAALVGIDLSSISTDVLVSHCREMERKAHMAEIPSHRNSKRTSKGKQRGSRNHLVLRNTSGPQRLKLQLKVKQRPKCFR